MKTKQIRPLNRKNLRGWSNKGAGLVEYSILVGLVSVAVLGTVFTLGNETRDSLESSSSLVDGVVGEVSQNTRPGLSQSASLALLAQDLPESFLDSPYSFDIGRLVEVSSGFARDEVVLSIDNLPAGLSFDPSSGIFSGRPTQTGTASFDVLASLDGAGQDQETYTLKTTDCYDAENVGRIGPEGALCEDMLIVDNTMLRGAAAPGFFGLGDGSFTVAPGDAYAPEDLSASYTFAQSERTLFTGQVTDMSSLFVASSFNGDISHWDTSSVFSMRNMFHSSSSFNQDISSWDTSSVADMFGMFTFNRAFNAPLNVWDTSSVEDMGTMFSFSIFNQDISEWNTSSVLNMRSMFQSNSTFNQSIGNWDISNVQVMELMFDNATNFNQDIAAWDTSSATDMTAMFSNARRFNQDLSGWCVEQIPSKPPRFDDRASAWASPSTTRPQWGVACSP